MPKNPGNAGHRGYRMAIVTDISAEGDRVKCSLSCGHIQYWQPGYGHTAESWASHIQEGYRPFVIGQTRLRCEERHDEK